MSDETDLRWLVERLDRTHAETSANIARLETQVAGIPASMDRYVRADVYEARERARDAREESRDGRIKRLEDTDTTKTTGNRVWLLGLVQTAFGVVLGLLGAYLVSKGH